MEATRASAPQVDGRRTGGCNIVIPPSPRQQTRGGGARKLSLTVLTLTATLPYTGGEGAGHVPRFTRWLGETGSGILPRCLQMIGSLASDWGLDGQGVAEQGGGREWE